MRRKFPLMGGGLLFLAFLNSNIVAGIPTPFEGRFIKQSKISLSTGGLGIGYLWSLAADDNGRLFFLDARGRQVLVFDNDGRFVSRVGNNGPGPGEFQGPRTVYIDSRHRIYIVDSKSRKINIYGPEGKYQSSFLFSSSHGPGDITVDSHKGVFMGALSVPTGSGARCDWLQKYDSQGRFVRSFYKDISGKDWVFRMNPNFLFDVSEDLIYAMQINRYDIQVFNNNGDLVKSFGRAPGYYRAPDESYVMDDTKFPSVEKIKAELYRLMESWTRPMHLEIVDPGTILIQSAANGLIKGISTKYVIDLWSTNGDLITEEIPCDYQFLCSDRKGNCYFLESTNQDEALEKDAEYIIGKYSLSLRTK